MQKGRDDVAPLLSFLSPPPSCVCVEGGSLPFLPPFFPFRVLDSPSPDSRLAGARFFPLGTQKGEEGGRGRRGPPPLLCGDAGREERSSWILLLLLHTHARLTCLLPPPPFRLVEAEHRAWQAESFTGCTVTFLLLFSSPPLLLPLGVFFLFLLSCLFYLRGREGGGERRQ